MSKTDEILTNNDKTAWEFIVAGNYEAFDKMLANDYQGVYSRGLTDKASELALLKSLTFNSAEVVESAVQWIDEKTAIVTSTVKVEMVFPDGTPRNETLRTTTVNTLRDGEWLCVYHTDTTILPMN